VRHRTRRQRPLSKCIVRSIECGKLVLCAFREVRDSTAGSRYMQRRAVSGRNHPLSDGGGLGSQGTAKCSQYRSERYPIEKAWHCNSLW